MKRKRMMAVGVLWVGMATFLMGQRGEEEVPLMRPDEKERVEEQADGFNDALSKVLGDAAKSTVRIWGVRNRRGVPEMISYGTVVGDGGQVLTKWSEVESAIGKIFVQTGSEESFEAEVVGVFTEDDLALLELRGGDGEVKLNAVEFEKGDLSYGKFLVAPQPTGRPGAFGVVSVLERNLRETDQAHLGVMADREYQGAGVRLSGVQTGYGADEAGLRAGDVILQIDGRNIGGLQELRNALADKQPGDMVEILVDAAGKERKVEVKLSNKPLMGQFSGDRLNAMERMGGELSRVRDGFSKVVQSDMKIQRNQVGGPVVDLDGKVVGISVARADRTRTYIMGSDAVMKLLEGEGDTIAEAKEKSELKRQELASQRRAMMPRMRSEGRPRDLGQMRRNLGDLGRLLDRANEELDALEREP